MGRFEWYLVGGLSEGKGLLSALGGAAVGLRMGNSSILCKDADDQ